MPENDGVEFDEVTVFDEIPHPKIEPPTLGEGLMNLGIVRTAGDAMILIAVLAFLLISVSIYLLATAVEQPKTLHNEPSNSEKIIQNQ